MEGKWKEPKAHTRATENLKKDRKSSMGTSGEPKKGGHGGKFTWSGDQRRFSDDGVVAMDSKDPNFEDPELEGGGGGEEEEQQGQGGKSSA